MFSCPIQRVSRALQTTLGGSELRLDLTRQDSALLPKRESTIQYKTAKLCSEIPAGSVSGEQDVECPVLCLCLAGGTTSQEGKRQSHKRHVVTPASAHRTIPSHHRNLHAAAAGRPAPLRSPQHPRGSLPPETGALSPALCAGSPAPVSAGRGRAPHPSPLLGWGTRRGQPPGQRQGQGWGRQEPPPRGAEGALGTGCSPRISTREVAPTLPGAAASSLRSRPPSLPPPSPPLLQNRRSRCGPASLAPVPAAERGERT